MMVKCFLSDLTPIFSSASTAVSTCIRVSAVPPDFEIAMKCVFFQIEALQRAGPAEGIGIVVEFDKGGLVDFLRSAVSAWPPRLEPPMPSTATVVKPLPRAAACLAWRRAGRRCAKGCCSSSSFFSAFVLVGAASPAQRRRSWPRPGHSRHLGGAPLPDSARSREMFSGEGLDMGHSIRGVCDTAPSLPIINRL